MKQPLWLPTSRQIRQSNLFRFIQDLNKTHATKLQNYPDLHQWSIQHPAAFWEMVSNFCQIIYSHPPENILIPHQNIWESTWFSGAQLNFAENLLRKQDDTTALLCLNELGHRTTLSYHTLNQSALAFAAALAQRHIIAGDRVVGILPNIPETVVSMLGTAALGGIWSSCSPEFGLDILIERFQQIEPKVLVITDGYRYKGHYFNIHDKIEALCKNIPSIQTVVFVPYLNNETPRQLNVHERITYVDFLKSTHNKVAFTQVPFQHPLYILFSSGTTGKPKCIVHGVGGTLLQHLKELVLHIDLKPNDVFFYYTSTAG